MWIFTSAPTRGWINELRNQIIYRELTCDFYCNWRFGQHLSCSSRECWHVRGTLLVPVFMALNYCLFELEDPAMKNNRMLDEEKFLLCQHPINININCSFLSVIVTGHSIRHLYANSQSFRLLHAYQLSWPELGCQQDKWWSGSFGRFNCG